MVGVPKSKRCTFCKTRKTKCDEKWPTCGTCARAGKRCSGPSDGFKFIVNGNHNEAATDTKDGTGASRFSLAGISASRAHRRRHDTNIIIFDPKHAFKDPCRFKSYSLSDFPKSLPWSQPDQIAARFVTCLRAETGTGNDLHILGAFVDFIPQHIGRGNAALGHAVELLLGAWTKSRQKLPSTTWLDLVTYNKALHSLTAALNDASVEPISTLTTLCLLQKIEVLYDFARGSNQENHAAGLIAVIDKGGLTQPMTEMALHVTFESIFHMLQEDIRQGRESQFYTKKWMMTLKKSIDDSNIDPILKHLYHLWVEMTAWPGLSRLVRILKENPSDTETAKELQMRATKLAELLRRQDKTVMASLAKSGAIREVENMDRPSLFPKCYEFANFPTSKLFSSHAWFSIITCRFLEEANKVLGCDDPSVGKQAMRFSRRVWMAHPWLRNQTPLAVDFTASLVFSYEAGNEEERNFCMASLREMDSFRHPPPIGVWVEETIMANAKAYSGRLQFLKTQDVSVEYEGKGCRS
ncbi:putative C6 zinc finger domain-containing protein [Rosellinia necatrix]|uniref:Putative C6 zinc finger domain-containing protein n=1 Tax=Rosellinia necatrix TaxID=77044 RepID=A0A1W2TFS6_ROSNE|nr:putative C6 zinc finger domain-containing protein [Rosellinia necatrix]